MRALLAALLGLAACAPRAPLPPRGDIPLFTAVGSDTPWEQRADRDLLARFDLLLVARTPGSVAALRAANPKVRILANVNPYFALGAGLWPDHAQDPEVVRPDWVLRDAKGAPIRYRGPLYPGMDEAHLPTLMDPTHREWRGHFLTTVLGLVTAEGLDGVFLDTLTASYPEFARTAEGAPSRGFEPEAWSRAAQDLLAATRAGLPRGGVVVWNGLSLAPGTSGDGDLALLAGSDGACYEAFGIAWPLDHDAATKRWYFTHAIRTAMVQARSLGKLFLLQVTCDETDAEVRLYALCAFLLERYDGAYFWLSRTESEPRWFPEWSTRLGAALGDAHERDGLWVREFEHARVLVNPAATPAGELPPFRGKIEAR